MSKLLLDALHCCNKDRPPVWLMRQAGRYMPQYRAIRAKHSFMQMVHDPEIATEISLLPVNLLKVDAAILFSDILVIAEALGVGLRFDEGKGPIIERPLDKPQDVDRLPLPNISESLHFVGETIKLLKPLLKVPLIGFCGAPFTLASYLIEGGVSRDFKKTKQWMLREPKSFHRLLDHIAKCTIDYIQLQIKAGVQVLQIFDSWANALGHAQFCEFALPYMQQVMQSVKGPKKIPVILFCRGSSLFATEMAATQPAAISVDWSGDIGKVRSAVPLPVALQGNLDPDLLYAPKSLLKREVKRMLKTMRNDPGYIFNLGHGIHPDVGVDAVKLLVDTVQGND